jgi:hypothetical protein
MRYYNMSMQVEQVLPEQMDILRRIFEEQWAEDEGFFCKDEQIALFSAHEYLYGGEGEEQAHKRVVAAVKAEIPDCSVTTRWTYLDDLPYEEYTD